MTSAKPLLCGRAGATVTNPGASALLAFVFGDYFSQVVPLDEYSSAIWALSIVLLIGSSIVALLMLRWRESVLCQLAQ